MDAAAPDEQQQHDKQPRPHQPDGSESAVALGLWGYIYVFGKLMSVSAQLIGKLVVAVAGGEKRRHGLSLHKYIASEGIRKYQAEIGAIYIQNLMPSTCWQARIFARDSHIPFSELHLRDGTLALRLGEPPATAGDAPGKIFVSFHGGGYMSPALYEQVLLACGFSKKLPEGVTVYILQYALTCETTNHYPRQLEQAVMLLEHLIHVQGIPPAAITLIGDSAGGHLAISLLLHCAHPNPKVPALDLGGQRLAGTALISPWVFAAVPDKGLAMEFQHKDVLLGTALNDWAHNLLGLAEAGSEPANDPWSCPLAAPSEWWADLPVDDLFITYGEDEILRDNIKCFCSALRLPRSAEASDQPARKIFVKGYAGEVHEGMVMNHFLRFNGPCESEDDFVAWYNAQVAAPVKTTPTSAPAGNINTSD